MTESWSTKPWKFPSLVLQEHASSMSTAWLCSACQEGVAETIPAGWTAICQVDTMLHPHHREHLAKKRRHHQWSSVRYDTFIKPACVVIVGESEEALPCPHMTQLSGFWKGPLLPSLDPPVSICLCHTSPLGAAQSWNPLPRAPVATSRLTPSCVEALRSMEISDVNPINVWRVMCVFCISTGLGSLKRAYLTFSLGKCSWSFKTLEWCDVDVSGQMALAVGSCCCVPHSH